MAGINNGGDQSAPSVALSFEEVFDNFAAIASFVKARFNKLPNDPTGNQSFGKLYQHGKGYRRPFLRVDGRRKDNEYFEHAYVLLTRYWGIPEPDYLVEVTGSAEELTFDDNPAQKVATLKDYIRKLVLNDEGKITWVITGGGNGGAMRLVGEALAEVPEAYCIGIGPWCANLALKASLEIGATKKSVPYNPDTSAQGMLILNMDHECFLLVDKGTGARGWGQEIEFRNSFIDYISRVRFSEKIPVVLLLIGGGAASLATANLAVAASSEDLNLGRYVEPRRLIVLSGTTRSADAIEWAWKEYDKAGENKADAFAEKAKSIIAQTKLIFVKASQQEIDKQIDLAVQRLRSIVMRKHLVTIVDVFNRTADLSDSLQIKLFDLKMPTQEERTCSFVDNNFEHFRCKSYFPIEESEKNRIEENLRKTMGDRICKCGRDDHPDIEASDWDNTQRTGLLYFYADPSAQTANLLEFVPSYSKFIRLPYNPDTCSNKIYLDKVCALMFEFWRMQKPQMLIEVTGTASDMRLIDQTIIKQLKIGIVRVAKRAKAWLIAGGTNGGVMKLVGDAVAEDRKTHGGIGVHCLGIAPYGMTDNRHKIFQKDSVIPPSLVRYPYKNDENFVARAKRGNQFELNPGYDHYILVDTGKENRFQEEIDFRAKLLGHLSEQKPYKTKTDCYRTPMVLLVCGGGPGTLKTIIDALNVSQGSRPIVILKGFGGVGDFLSSVQDRFQKNDPSLKDDPALISLAGKRSPTEVYNEIAKIFQNPKLITIVDMSSQEAMAKQSLDDAIVEAIFKIGPSSDDKDVNADNWIKSSFELALKWNRIEAALKLLSDQKRFRIIQEAQLRSDDAATLERAKTVIDTPVADNRSAPLLAHKAMTFAIKRGQSTLFEFYIVSGLIEPRSYFHGNSGEQLAVILHKLFWHPSSWKSHKKVVPTNNLHLFKHILEKEHKEPKVGPNFSFRFNYDASDAAIEQLIALEETVEPAFRANLQLPASVISRATKFQHVQSMLDRDENDLQYEMAVRNLFLLNLLLCRDDFAVSIWKVANVSDYLGTAVIAVIFLENLASAADDIRRRDLCETYQELSKKWEKRALAVIQKLSLSQSSSLARILTRSLRTWHGANVLQMAYHGNRLQIMAHSAIQIELEKVWKGQHVAQYESLDLPKATKALSARRITKILANWFKDLPEKIRVFSNRNDVNPESELTTVKAYPIGTTIPEGKSVPASPIQIDAKVSHVNERFKKVKANSSYDAWTAQAVARFYETSPRIKFTFYVFSLMVFLFVLYGDVVITTHEPQTCAVAPSIQMIYIWVCAAMFTADAFHEIHTLNRGSIDNATTIIGAIFMVTSFILRMICYKASPPLSPYVFSFSRIFYALSCIFFWLKCFSTLFVFKSLGPMVLTLYEMFKDLAFFVLLHFIVLLTFAAPIYSLATMPENRDGHSDTNEYFALMARIIYYRWWNIVGISMDDSKEKTLGDTCANVLEPDETFAETESNALAGSNASNGSESYFGQFLSPTTATTSTTDESFCDFRSIISSVLLMFFLLLTNIVLLNMLIASFSFTITDYRGKAELLWKFGRYSLIRSFSEKPVLPPPLNIFELALFNSGVFGRCLKKRWSNTFETHFAHLHDGDEVESEESMWTDQTELRKFRYRELNGIEKTAVSKVLDEEAQIEYEVA